MLKAFYQAYAKWLDAGAPNGQPFYRRHGLCGNLTRFTDDWEPLLNAMIDQFKEAGLDTIYPFGGEYAFETEYDNATAHLNPARIKWVKEHCK